MCDFFSEFAVPVLLCLALAFFIALGFSASNGQGKKEGLEQAAKSCDRTGFVMLDGTKYKCEAVEG